MSSVIAFDLPQAENRHGLHKTLARSSKGGYVALTVQAVHTYDCQFWRMGKKHGPCNCGAHEEWERWNAAANPQSSEGGGNREHLSSAKAAAAPDSDSLARSTPEQENANE